MKNNKTNFILIFSSVIFIIFIASFVYFFNIIKNKNKHISAIVSALDKKVKDKENLEKLRSRASELEDLSNKINSYIVDTNKVDTFVEYLEKVGIDNGVSLVVTNVDIVKNDKNKISVILNIKGDFSNIMKLLFYLEYSPYYISINSLSINKYIIPIENQNNLNIKDKNLHFDEKHSWQADINFNVISI